MRKLNLALFLLLCILASSFMPSYADNNLVFSKNTSEFTFNEDNSVNAPRRPRKRGNIAGRGKKEEKGYQIGFEVGANMTQIMTSNDYVTIMKGGDQGEYKLSMGIGFHVGAYFNLRLNDMLFLEEGLYISQISYEEAGKKIAIIPGPVPSVIAQTYVMTDKPMYFKVPILLGAKFNLSDNFAMTVKAGPFLDGGIGGNHTVVSTSINPLTMKPEEVKADTNYFHIMNSFDFGARVVIGAEISSFTFGVFLDYGFMNLLRQDLEGKLKMNKMSFGINVGYKF